VNGAGQCAILAPCAAPCAGNLKLEKSFFANGQRARPGERVVAGPEQARNGRVPRRCARATRSPRLRARRSGNRCSRQPRDPASGAIGHAAGFTGNATSSIGERWNFGAPGAARTPAMRFWILVVAFSSAPPKTTLSALRKAIGGCRCGRAGYQQLVVRVILRASAPDSSVRADPANAGERDRPERNTVQRATMTVAGGVGSFGSAANCSTQRARASLPPQRENREPGRSNEAPKPAHSKSLTRTAFCAALGAPYRNITSAHFITVILDGNAATLWSGGGGIFMRADGYARERR
jgi:hypothetical protein